MSVELIASPINGYACPSDPGEPGTGKPRLSINNEEGRILQALIRGYEVLEIGTGLGVSTGFLAQAANRVFTVDIDPWVHEYIWPTLPKNVITLKEITGIRLCVQATFIDGMHEYEAVKRDIEIARLCTRQHGLIIFHDLYIAGVAQALIDSGLPFVHIQTTAGMAVAWND
jgi:hypothetical protein